jgi:hypothetical protein
MGSLGATLIWMPWRDAIRCTSVILLNLKRGILLNLRIFLREVVNKMEVRKGWISSDSND